jgi:hypothetical protein
VAAQALTRSEEMRAVVIGIDGLIPYGGGQAEEWNVVISAPRDGALFPVLVILLWQQWFVGDLIETQE